MALIAIRRSVPEKGLRPLIPGRDLLGVADLIEEAFASELDRSGRQALREMRWMGRWGKLLLLLDYMSPDESSFLNGFVWEEDERIIGNVTVSRHSSDGRRWFISNVAVSKAFRGRGIARALMDAALEFVREMRGRVVSLQVREGNEPAIHLYKTMAFKTTGAVTQYFMAKPRPVEQLPLPSDVRLRPHRFDAIDARDAFSLARMVIPDGLQQESPLKFRTFRLESDIHFSNVVRRLFGMGTRQYWVAETLSGKMIATLNIEPGMGKKEHSLGFLVHPNWQGKLEAVLVSKALAHLAQWPSRPILFQYPEGLQHSASALENAGFSKRRTLLWMRREM